MWRTPQTQLRLPGAARDFSPRVNFQCRLSYGVRTPPYAIACIYICAHVEDPVVHVRVRWIMETMKHPACTVGWVARLCRSWLSTGKATRISYGRNPISKKSSKAREKNPQKTPPPRNCNARNVGKTVKFITADCIMFAELASFPHLSAY